MIKPKKLIEVAMPIKEISAENVRDTRVQHGHISSLHQWWARRPLPVCRAVVFASLVPDPLDPNCPQAFRDAIEILLGKGNNPGDPFGTYADIPWTSVFDPMEDNLRNRLQMFIGKFTQTMQQHLLGKATKPVSEKVLSDYSLIKWDNKNDEKIINKARKLIWVAHNCQTDLVEGPSAKELLVDFDMHYKAIKTTEEALYSLTDRHLETENCKQLTVNLHTAIEAFLNKMPKVFDPFAGGGAIPLEAARLGCRSYGNDINPVAHIIQKGGLEFPQKYGKPILYSIEEFTKLYGEEELNKISNENKIYKNGKEIGVNISNRLSFDVKFYANKILKMAENEIGYLYPSDENNMKPLAYYWTRIGKCSNPTCQAEIPLLKQFYLVNTKNKKIFLKPIINNKNIHFEILNGKYDERLHTGWINRGNLICPCCSGITNVNEIKRQSIGGFLKQKIVCVIQEGKNGKEYRLPTENEIEITEKIPYIEIPNEDMQRNSAGGDTFGWGITKWGQLFSSRQLVALQTIVNQLNLLKLSLKYFDEDYSKAIISYLAISIDKMATRLTSFGLIDKGRETFVGPFSRQALAMVFDYPEINPFKMDQTSWITRLIESENFSFPSICNNASSGEKEQFNHKELTAVITDPPYYDAIAYADLSDFYYVWLKRTLGDVYPINFATPQTPKTDECTALKHHHENDKDNAKSHFENKLLEIFGAIEHQTSDMVSIMFAHQSTEAWTTLCNSILGARMNITGSWAIDSEATMVGLKSDKAFLSSSVTVSCVPSQAHGTGDFKEVKKAIEVTVAKEVEELYRLGFRGSDLLTACFGQAVSEFGKYKKVEKADGSEVTVAELLTMARESAFNALLKGFDGDEYTKFYIGWLQLNGFAESDFDDAATFAKAGLSINVSELFKENILIQNKNKQTLATFAERNKLKPNLGARADSFLIDHVHKAMELYKGTNRVALLNFIKEKASAPDGSFWRVVTSLDELLPKECDDQKMTKGLITNKESLIRESNEIQKTIVQQGTLELE